MIKVICPVVENVEEFQKFVSKNQSGDVQFHVGVGEGVPFKSEPNVVVHMFKGKPNKEEIINALQSVCATSNQKCKVMVVRRPLTDQEFVALANSHMDIAYLRKKHNKFSTFFKKLWAKILKTLFSFTFFDDISAICFSENMFDLIRVCPNLSIASRINQYVGVDIESIETNEKTVRKDYSKPKNWLLLTLWTLVFAGSVTGGVLLLTLTKIRAIFVVLVIAWMIVSLIILFFEILNFTRALSVGDLRFERAEQIDVSIFQEEQVAETKTAERKTRKAVAEQSVSTKSRAKASTKTSKTAKGTTAKPTTNAKKTKTTEKKAAKTQTTTAATKKSTKTTSQGGSKGVNKKNKGQNKK